MHLRRIVLRGFKSFADPTSLELGPGLCVVVGPNGAGKSNLVDALRWVLGESRAQDLRTQRAEDLIFQGSAERRAAPAAEVTLTFADETHQMGLPTSEVVVVRRVDRDGISECQINGRNCRLKDVQQLVLGTGLAPSGYAFIAQGSIEDVVSQGPHSRRLMLEEAAGASLYRQRRTQALAELAQADLLVQDLASELERLSGEGQRLDQEVERLDRWQALREQALELEIALEGRRLQELARRRRQVTERLERQRLDVEGLKASAAQLEQAIEPLWQIRQGIDLAALETDERLAQVETRLGRLSEQVANRQARLGELSDRKQRAVAELAALTEQLRVVGDRARGDRARLEAILTLVAEVEQLAGPGLPVIDAARWGELRAAALMAEGPVREQPLGIEDDLRQLEATSADTERRLVQIRAEAQQQLAARQQLGRQLEMLERRAAQAAEAERAHWSAGRPLRAGPRAVMEAADQGRLSGILGPLGGLIKCEPKMATALGVALGGAYDNLVVIDEAAAEAAIDYLRQGHLGRATFLPLNRVRSPTRPRDFSGHAGYLGVLSDQISYPNQVEPAVELVLGRTHVAETLEAALKLSRSEGLTSRWVSLDGDLLLPGGAIQGGDSGQPNAQRDHAQEAVRLNQIRDQAAAMDRRLEELYQERSELQLALAHQVQELSSMRRQLAAMQLSQAVESGLKPALLAIDDEMYERWCEARQERGRVEERLTALADQESDLSLRRQLAESEIGRCEVAIQEVEADAGLEAGPGIDSQRQLLHLRQGRQALRRLARQLELLERAARERTALTNNRLVRLEESDLRLADETAQLDEDLVACRRRLHRELGAPEGGPLPTATGTFDDLARLRHELNELEPVNPGSRPEAARVQALRLELTERRLDTLLSKERLLTLAAEADQQLDAHYKEALSRLEVEFQRIFAEMFPGGLGDLVASPDGVDFRVTLGGRRSARLTALSGGERALVALCWLIALVELNPVPFLCLDEVETSLDEENIRRLLTYFDAHRDRQVVMVSHQRMTMEWADLLIGVTMDRPGESRLVEVRLEEAWRGELGAV